MQPAKEGSSIRIRTSSGSPSAALVCGMNPNACGKHHALRKNSGESKESEVGIVLEFVAAAAGSFNDGVYDVFTFAFSIFTFAVAVKRVQFGRICTPQFLLRFSHLPGLPQRNLEERSGETVVNGMLQREIKRPAAKYSEDRSELSPRSRYNEGNIRQYRETYGRRENDWASE